MSSPVPPVLRSLTPPTARTLYPVAGDTTFQWPKVPKLPLAATTSRPSSHPIASKYRRASSAPVAVSWPKLALTMSTSPPLGEIAQSAAAMTARSVESPGAVAAGARADDVGARRHPPPGRAAAGNCTGHPGRMDVGRDRPRRAVAGDHLIGKVPGVRHVVILDHAHPHAVPLVAAPARPVRADGRPRRTT